MTQLKWLAPLLAAWQEKARHACVARQHWGAILAEQAQKLIARIWKLRQLVINGYAGWKKTILDLEETLSLLTDQDETGMQLCQLLMENLDSVPRASSMIEKYQWAPQAFLKRSPCLSQSPHCTIVSQSLYFMVQLSCLSTLQTRR